MPTIPKPTTSTGSDARPEYEVVWNGVHHDQDADLLTPIGAPRAKSLAVPTPPKRRDATDRVHAVLPTREPDAVTLQDLVRSTGLTATAVTHALYQLRHRNRLKTVNDRPLRAPYRYWKPAETAVANEQILVGGVGDWLRRE